MSSQFVTFGEYELNAGLFRDTTVGQLIYEKPGDCVVVDESDHVDKALSLMSARGFTSIPVRNKANQIIGILNMGDIVAHMSGYKRGPGGDVATFDDGQRHRHLDPSSASKTVPDPMSLAIPCSQLVGLTWESRHLVVFNDFDRLDTVIARLTSGNHRALVQGKGWLSIISQWDITKWLAGHSRELDDPNLASDRKNFLGSFVNSTLGELGLAVSKPVVALPSSMTAMDGFKALALNGVSAMPILDPYKGLCGTLSTSDIRGTVVETLKSLNLPILDFLKVANTLQYPQVTCDEKTTFCELLLKIQARDVHRVWMLDRNNQLSGVVSLTDIFSMLAKHLMPSKGEVPPLGTTSGVKGMAPSAPDTMSTGPAAPKEMNKDIPTTDTGMKGTDAGMKSSDMGMRSGEGTTTSTLNKGTM
jgi:CBS-domain-containing membrane protein